MFGVFFFFSCSVRTSRVAFTATVHSVIPKADWRHLSTVRSWFTFNHSGFISVSWTGIHDYVCSSLPVFQVIVHFIAHRDTGVLLPHRNELLVSLRACSPCCAIGLSWCFPTAKRVCHWFICFYKGISEVEHSWPVYNLLLNSLSLTLTHRVFVFVCRASSAFLNIASMWFAQHVTHTCSWHE